MVENSRLSAARQADTDRAATRCNPPAWLLEHRIGARYAWGRYVDLMVSVRRAMIAQNEARLESVRSQCESRRHGLAATISSDPEHDVRSELRGRGSTGRRVEGRGGAQ